MTRGDDDLAAWLAGATGGDPALIAAELELGRRRRDFVSRELVDAGFEGPELVELLMRLTGVDEREARTLASPGRSAAGQPGS